MSKRPKKSKKALTGLCEQIQKDLNHWEQIQAQPEDPQKQKREKLYTELKGQIRELS